MRCRVVLWIVVCGVSPLLHAASAPSDNDLNALDQDLYYLLPPSDAAFSEKLCGVPDGALNVARCEEHAEDCVLQHSPKTEQRRGVLLEKLQGGDVRFEDVKKEIYGRQQRQIFQTDILHIMHDGWDICETTPGYYHCTGKCSKGPDPSEHVAVAMLKLIEDKDPTLFELKFQLYKSGYLSYAPMTLEYFERALVISGLHPHRHDAKSKMNEDFFAAAQQLWGDMPTFFCRQEFAEHLQSKYKNFLKSSHNSQTIWRLWELYDDNIENQVERRGTSPLRDPQEVDHDISCEKQRRASLLQKLQDGDVRFEDVRREIYGRQRRKIFQTDVLYIMYDGWDICETKPEHYHCVGKCVKGPPPSEDVAVAMLRLIEDKGPTLFELKFQSLFELKFQLYKMGYLSYAPKALDYIERALVISGLHPYQRDVRSKNADFCEVAQQLWKNIQCISSKKEFTKHLRGLKKTKYKKVFKSNHNMQVFWYLWDLHDKNVLRQVECMRASRLRAPEDTLQSQGGAHDMPPTKRMRVV